MCHNKNYQNVSLVQQRKSNIDPRPDLIFWHSFWHTIWKYLLNIYSDILSEISYSGRLWHSIWHAFWHIFWPSFWQSIWNVFGSRCAPQHLRLAIWCFASWAGNMPYNNSSPLAPVRKSRDPYMTGKKHKSLQTLGNSSHPISAAPG